MKEVFENGMVKMEISNGVLFQYYKEGLSFSLDVSKQVAADRLKFLNGRCCPVIVFNEGIVDMDMDSRDFFASEEGFKGLSIVAFVETMHTSKVLISFSFLEPSNPEINFISFDDIDEAIDWLKIKEKALLGALLN